MTPHLRKLVMQNVGAAEIRDGAIEEGMLTLRMDAWLKVMKGITTTRADDPRDVGVNRWPTADGPIGGPR